ncbi:uncharacterized protein [Euphorbia lathyris]
MECIVLKHLGFQVFAPTAKSFLRRFLRAPHASYKVNVKHVMSRGSTDRVKEPREPNVSLQRKFSSFNEREIESRSIITCSNQQDRHLTPRVEEVDKENIDLKYSPLFAAYKIKGCQW